MDGNIVNKSLTFVHNGNRSGEVDKILGAAIIEHYITQQQKHNKIIFNDTRTRTNGSDSCFYHLSDWITHQISPA